MFDTISTYFHLFVRSPYQIQSRREHEESCAQHSRRQDQTFGIISTFLYVLYLSKAGIFCMLYTFRSKAGKLCAEYSRQQDQTFGSSSRKKTQSRLAPTIMSTYYICRFRAYLQLNVLTVMIWITINYDNKNYDNCWSLIFSRCKVCMRSRNKRPADARCAFSIFPGLSLKSLC